MGLNVFGVLVIWTAGEEHVPTQHISLLTLVIVNAIASYVGASIWIYEKARAGTIAMLVVTILSLTSAYLTTLFPETRTITHTISVLLEIISSGALLGAVMMSMLLGHWYLTASGMSLAPLWRLNAVFGVATLLRIVLATIGLSLVDKLPGTDYHVTLLALRWLVGLIGPLVVVVMVWRILKYRNTQAATGVLYTGVLLTVTGELAATLLSRELSLPV